MSEIAQEGSTDNGVCFGKIGSHCNGRWIIIARSLHTTRNGKRDKHVQRQTLHGIHQLGFISLPESVILGPEISYIQGTMSRTRLDRSQR